MDDLNAQYNERIRNCDHVALILGSGDYYVICSICQAKWGKLKAGQPESGTDANGQPIGCAPDVLSHLPLVGNRYYKV